MFVKLHEILSWGFRILCFRVPLKVGAKRRFLLNGHHSVHWRAADGV